MKPINNCPVCGGETVTKRVEKLLKSGTDSAVISVTAEVCLHCGERLYSEDTVRRFEQIRDKLARRETAEFESVGSFYRAG